MSAKSFRNILIKGDPIRKEAIAGGAITPGHLVKRSAANTVVVHATASGDAQKLFALEEDLIGGSIDTAYAQNDQCYLSSCRSGDEVFALLPASATAVTVGMPLCSNGDGCLKKHVADTVDTTLTDTTDQTIYGDQIVAYALEAVDNSSGAAVARIQVEIA